MKAGASPASRDRGGEAKLKSGGQRFSPKCEGFFWLKSQIFRPKPGDLQKKKKVFAEIRGFFLAEIANFNVFSAQKHQLFPPKKIPWRARKKSGGQKRKSGGQPFRWRRACVKAGLMLKMMNVYDAQPYQKTTNNIREIEKIVREDRRLSIRLIAERMSIDKETMWQVLHDNLHMTKVCAQIVSKLLTSDQKEKRQEICADKNKLNKTLNF